MHNVPPMTSSNKNHSAITESTSFFYFTFTDLSFLLRLKMLLCDILSYWPCFVIVTRVSIEEHERSTERQAKETGRRIDFTVIACHNTVEI